MHLLYVSHSPSFAPVYPRLETRLAHCLSYRSGAVSPLISWKQDAQPYHEMQRGVPSFSLLSNEHELDFGEGEAHPAEPDWTSEQLDVLHSLFERPPRRSKIKGKPRPLPLPLPSMKSAVGMPRTRLTSRKLSDKYLKRDLPKTSQFLTKLAAEIHALSESDNVRTHLDKYASRLIRGSLSATIRELGYLGDSERALEVFLWQERYPYLWPDERTFCAILEVLAEAGKQENVWKLLDLSSETPSKAFESSILGFLKCGGLEQALQVKDAAQLAGCVLNQRVFAKLIHVAGRTIGGEEIVLRLVEELGSFPEFKLKLEDCTAVMAACSNVGLYEAVESLFQWWKSAGCQPNIVMFTILMKARCKVGKHRKALAVYWDMEEVGCSPDLPAFKVMLDTCGKTGDTRMALKLFEMMKDDGFSPMNDVYNTLIILCCKDNMHGKAQGLLKEMQAMGLTINDDIKELIPIDSISSGS